MNKKSLKPTRVLVGSKNNVIGLVHPYRMDYKVFGNVPEGTTIYKAISQACKAANVHKRLLDYAIIQIGKRDNEKQTVKWEFLPFSQWKKRKLEKDELLRFRILPKGGNGGNKTNSVLMIGVAILAIAAAAVVAGPIAASMGWTVAGGGLSGMGIFMSGLAGMAVMTIGSLLVNAIAPVTPPSIGSMNTSRAAESDVYSISGGRNQIKQWQRVPVPVGQGRFAPPLAAAPYTQLSGEDQYLHQLFCLGIGDMEISDIKIGPTSINKFDECVYEVMTYTPGSGRSPRYYPTGVLEDNLNIQLKYNVDAQQTTRPDCDYAEIDLSFQGLGRINDEGGTDTTSVCFNISYRKSGTTDWNNVGQSKYFAGKNISAIGPQYGIKGIIGVNVNNGPFIRKMDNPSPGINEIMLGWYEVYTETRFDNTGDDGGYAYDVHRVNVHNEIKANGHDYDGFDIRAYADEVCIGGGNIRKFETGAGTISSQSVCIEGAQTRLLRKTIRLNFPARGTYDISILRTTPDATDDKDGNRLRNESYWTALRSMFNKLPVETKYPVMLLSLRVKASGQLSGSIDTLTVFYRTKCWDYNGSGWSWRYTSNPASIFRYILQQKNAFAQPQDDNLIDFPSIIDAYKFASSKNFNYNKVFDGSASVFERLKSVCSSMLASPTMIDGKWAIIVDKPRENVVCAFTSANAWQWSFERQQVRLPQAIHCNFVNEETWDTDMRVVYTDEPLAGEYVHETQEYEGVTNPAQIYQLARFHYADAKMRRRTISFKCYDEAILCTRGDLVELACPNINVAGLQVGRVRKITRNADNQVVSFTTDQINTTDLSARRFGVKIYANSGQIFHAEVQVENKSQRKITLLYPREMNIQDGNKYAFGDYSEEVFQAIVLSMKFNTDWTCDIVCQDYTPAIYGDLSKPIPEWHSIITRPIEHKWMLYGVPIILRAISDERALIETTTIKGVNGALLCRIRLYVRDPRDIDPRAKYYNSEVRQILDRSNPENIIYGDWRTGASMESINQSYLYINNVDEDAEYQIRVRYTGIAGEVGEWSKIFEHRVVGKLNPPADVKNFKATIDNPNGIKLTWTQNKELDIAYYEISGAVSRKVQYPPRTEKIYNRTGNIPFEIVAVDVGGRKSPHPAQASVDVLPPPNVIVYYSRLLDEGIVTSWMDNNISTWNIDYVKVTCGKLVGKFPGNTGTLRYVGTFNEGEKITAQAKDIFDNWSEIEVSKTITVYHPQTPIVKLGYNKFTGKITLDWQDCRNPTLPNTPSIDHYEVRGTLASDVPVKVKGTHYEADIPLTIIEYGSHTIPGGIEIHVGNVRARVSAVDKYGIASGVNPVDLAIRLPNDPTDFRTSLATADGEQTSDWTKSTAIILSWRDCETTFAIDYYLVYDQFTQTSYKIATNYVVLVARKEGQYPITVQAVDVLGQESTAMTYYLNIKGVGGMVIDYEISGADILLKWETPDASFQIDHYIVFKDNDDLPTGTNSDQYREGYVGQAKTNFIRIPARQAGNFVYYVWAVDIVGNINTEFANYKEVVIKKLPAPVVRASLQGNGITLDWEINAGNIGLANTLPPVEWEVRRYNKLENVSEIPNKTELNNYGRIAANKLDVAAFRIENNEEVGKCSFAVRAIDSGGNLGAWGICEFVAKRPGQVTFVNSVVIDNNVQLYWTVPNSLFFPIREYVFEEIDQDTQIPMLIGTVDAQFASEVEEKSGIYTYAITPIDVGGNRGRSNKITLRVSQPPDFVFYDKYESLFNGHNPAYTGPLGDFRQNMVLDGKGSMLGPVPVGETWEQNIARMTQLAGRNIATHKDKIDAGWKYWLEPRADTGVYIETIDHGTKVPSTNYKITLGYVSLSGNPVITCKVELSEDGTTWRLASDNALSLYVTQFRYSRITLTITGGFVQITGISIRLDVKKLTDYGTVHCLATDNDTGWTSEAATPMKTGTWVPFKVKFTDVQSLPKPNVVNKQDYTAFTVFEDIINPQGFRIFVKDKNGARVTADVSWVAMGV